VKQVGLLSPKLFSIYIEPLIEALIRSGIVHSLNNVAYGLILYADDVLMLCDTLDKAQRAANICS
jgi:hypothetical protein